MEAFLLSRDEDLEPIMLSDQIRLSSAFDWAKASSEEIEAIRDESNDPFYRYDGGFWPVLVYVETSRDCHYWEYIRGKFVPVWDGGE